jgi:hypothetical protein
MIRSTSVFLALSLAAGLAPGLALAQAPNGPSGPVPQNAVVGSEAVNAGRFLCTAAINSDGTIATTLVGSFIDPVNTHLLFTGAYQVAFKGPCANVQSINGWFRIIQPDTLTTGTLPALTCVVADRFGLPSALFIECFNSAGALTNTSFTVSASR